MGLTVNLFAILASAVVVAGGLWRLAAAVLRVRDDLHENKRVIIANTAATQELSSKMDSRMMILEDKYGKLQHEVDRLKGRLRRPAGGGPLRAETPPGGVILGGVSGRYH